MVDVAGINDFAEGSQDFVIIPLLGQVKGEDHTRQHLIHCVNVTDSGINVWRWVSRLSYVHRTMGRISGPAFVNPWNGRQTSTSEMNDLFIDLISEIFEDNRDLFPVDIRGAGELSEKYHVYRSFRRGSESRAVSKEVSPADRYQVNRWRKKEKAAGSKMPQPIDQLYVDVTLVKDAFLRYTKAMYSRFLVSILVSSNRGVEITWCSSTNDKVLVFGAKPRHTGFSSTWGFLKFKVESSRRESTCSRL